MLALKKTNKVEAARLANCNEEVVALHFFENKAGLQTSLLVAGIMNKDTGEIDVSRVLNIDESPQYVDFHAKVGNNVEKIYCGAGQQAVTGVAQNRECNTVDLAWGADGMAYGTHLMLGCGEDCESYCARPDRPTCSDCPVPASRGW